MDIYNRLLENRERSSQHKQSLNQPDAEIFQKALKDSDDSEIKAKQLISYPDKPIFIAITGGFKGDGSDVTEKVEGNSDTEKIYKSVETKGANIDGLYIAPGKTCASTVNTITNFVNKNRQSNEALVIYGYSNGGRCAIDAATALQHQSHSVDLLVTVDATDRKKLGTNNTVDNTIPANVLAHHNFYQKDECGIFTCPQGSEHVAESPHSTSVTNYLTKEIDITDPKHKAKLHRYMEEINKQAILGIINAQLKSKDNQ